MHPQNPPAFNLLLQLESTCRPILFQYYQIQCYIEMVHMQIYRKYKKQT